MPKLNKERKGIGTTNIFGKGKEAENEVGIRRIKCQEKDFLDMLFKEDNLKHNYEGSRAVNDTNHRTKREK